MRKIFLTLMLLHFCLSAKVVETESAPSEIDSGDSGSPGTPVTMIDQFCSKHCSTYSTGCTKLGSAVNCCGDGVVDSG